MSHNDTIYVAKREFHDFRFGMVLTGQEITNISEHSAKELIAAKLIAPKEIPEPQPRQDNVSAEATKKENTPAEQPKTKIASKTKKEKVNVK